LQVDDRTVTDYTNAQPAARPVGTPAVREPKLRKRRRGFGIVIFVILVAAAGYWLYSSQASAPTPSRGDASVQVIPVVAMSTVKGAIDITQNALGTVTSLATVTIKSQISGQLVRVAYQEGQLVNKGELLAEIDSRPYELMQQQAQAAMERDQAMLQSAELDLKRYQDLSKTNAIPRQQLDQQVALVAQDKANLISDQAQIDTAKLNITYCHIIAPVSGRVGLRLVDQGNYVTPGDATGIVVITQIKPISVIFTVAEDHLPQILKRLNVAKTLPVTAFDRSGTTKLAIGELRTLDNQIDTTTGTVKLRADFPNEEENLFPNQFVNVTLLIDVLQDATVISTAAVQRGAPGTFVYLVNADNTVTVRPVTLGPTNYDQVAVAAGLSPGDLVVVDGADKLRDGTKVSLRAATNGNATPAAGPSGRPDAGRPQRARDAP
jgi:multidrug efflux system membrane fusion protein